MKARDVMTVEPACCVPTDTIQQAAKLMVEADCGCIPIVDHLQTKKIVGTLTDRDIACRCTREGRALMPWSARPCRWIQAAAIPTTTSGTLRES